MFPLFQTSEKVTITELRTPSEIFRPSLSIDGDQWCALYGKNIQDGVTGFGKSPQEAMNDFDKNFNEKLAPRPNHNLLSNCAGYFSIADSQIVDVTIAEKSTISHLAKDFPLEKKSIEEIKTPERIIGCQEHNCKWNSDYACFHEFPIFAFRTMFELQCTSKED